MLATESKESSEKDHLFLQRLLLLLRLLLCVPLLLLLLLLMSVRHFGRRASDSKRTIRRVRVTAADSVMMAISKLRRGIRRAGDDRRAAARSRVPIWTVVTRGTAASIEYEKYKYMLIVEYQREH